MVHIWTELGEAGAARGAVRGDVVMIIDALRASTTIIAALHVGAARVIPVLTVEQAEAYQNNGHYRVAGERGGARLPQFHYGNSPTEILAHAQDVAGRTLVLTTSNGTRCVQAALQGGAAVLVGAPVNAGAAARAAFDLAQMHHRDITLVAAGINEQPTQEDSFSARLIAQRLQHWGAIAVTPFDPADESGSLDVFLHADPSARLAALGYAEDVRFCAQVDIWQTAPVYRDGAFSA